MHNHNCLNTQSRYTLTIWLPRPLWSAVATTNSKRPCGIQPQSYKNRKFFISKLLVIIFAFENYSSVLKLLVRMIFNGFTKAKVSTSDIMAKRHEHYSTRTETFDDNLTLPKSTENCWLEGGFELASLEYRSATLPVALSSPQALEANFIQFKCTRYCCDNLRCDFKSRSNQHLSVNFCSVRLSWKVSVHVYLRG